MKRSKQPTSMAPVKNRNNDRKKMCLLYGFTLFALTLSISVGSITKPNTQNALSETIHPVFFINLHSIACLTIILMALYFEIHSKETFEKVHQSTGPVPFSVKYSARGEKVNLYLRLGLLMFGFMSVGYVVARMQGDVTNLEYGGGAVEIIFFVCQTLFILRYHRIVILYHNKIFGTLLVHLMATNLCTWTDVSVAKIFHLFSKHAKHKNETHTQKESYHSNEDFSYNIVTYLMPTVSEYSLLAAALFYELTVRIGEPSYIELKELMSGTEIPLLDEYEEDHTTSVTFKTCYDPSIENSTDNTIIQKKLLSKKGPFRSGLGCYAAIMTVTTIASITVVISTMKKDYWMTYVLFVEELLLHTSGVACTILAFKQTRQLKFSIATKQSLVDEFLLYLALFFTANYIISNIINASLIVYSNIDLNSHKRVLLIIRAVLDSIEFLQTLLQTYFIQDSFHRCCDQLKHKEEKPGRQLVASLLGINLALWILKSFQMKRGDIFNDIHQELVMSRILIVISLPLNLFYRYHCTVCLSQCFTKLYEEETRRFEEMWRFESGQFTELLTLPTNICPKCNTTSYTSCDSPDDFRTKQGSFPYHSLSLNQENENKFEKKDFFFTMISHDDKCESENLNLFSDDCTKELPNSQRKKTSFTEVKNRSLSRKFLDTPVHKTIKTISASLDPIRKNDANFFRKSFKKNGENRRRTLRNMETAKYRVLAAELAHQMVVHRTNPGPDAGALIKRRFTSAFPEVFKKNSPTTSIGNANELQDKDWLEAVQATAAITVAPTVSDSEALSKILNPLSLDGNMQKKKSASFLFSLPEEDSNQQSTPTGNSFTLKSGEHDVDSQSEKVHNDERKRINDFKFDRINIDVISSPVAVDTSPNSSMASLDFSGPSLKTKTFTSFQAKKHKETKV